MKDRIQQLKALKNERRAGAVSSEMHAKGRSALLEAISVDESEKKQTSPWYVSFSFARSFANEFITQPVTAFASIAIIVLGSMTTVSASSNSLPGDPLYGLKIATERAQLQVVSADRRAILHTELAERRLNELAELTRNPNSQPELIANTVNALREQIQQAKQEAKRADGRDSNISQLSEVTNRLDKIAENTIKEVTSSPETAREIVEATKEASDSVIESTVTSHEQNESNELSRNELQEMFRERYTALKNREAVNLGRLSVIESSPDRSEVVTLNEVRSLKADIALATDKINQSLSLAAAGGFRDAFEILSTADKTLLYIEEIIAEKESLLIEFVNTRVAEEVEKILEEKASAEENQNEIEGENSEANQNIE